MQQAMKRRSRKGPGRRWQQSRGAYVTVRAKSPATKRFPGPEPDYAARRPIRTPLKPPPRGR